MAKLKVEMDRDSTKVKFCSIRDAEIFVVQGKTCMRTERLLAKINAVCLDNGDWMELEDDVLVTYVQKAELKLTI
jgi:hypothetical protein